MKPMKPRKKRLDNYLLFLEYVQFKPYAHLLALLQPKNRKTPLEIN